MCVANDANEHNVANCSSERLGQGLRLLSNGYCDRPSCKLKLSLWDGRGGSAPHEQRAWLNRVTYLSVLVKLVQPIATGH